jgi:hypothetical protein
MFLRHEQMKTGKLLKKTFRKNVDCIHPEVGGRMVFRNDGKYLLIYMALYPPKNEYLCVRLSEHYISLFTSLLPVT